MPDRPEPSEPTKLFCAKVNVNHSPGGSVNFDLMPADINDIPQDAKDHISTTFGQDVLTALLSSYPQYPQGSDTLDIEINAPTFIVYMKGPGNWFFRDEPGNPPMRLKPGQNPGNEFGPVVNCGGTGNKTTAYGVFAKYMTEDGEFEFDIFSSSFQQSPNPNHETKLVIDPVIKNDG